MIVVSHRGPYRFEAVGDGSFASERGAGGLASALGAVVERGEHDVTWIAAAISDDDRSAAASGSLDDLEIDLRLVAFDPEMHAMHYDVVSNSVLWFLFHDLFDRTRRPRFDRHFREAWDAYPAVNVAFAEATADGCIGTRHRLVNDYQLALTGAQLRKLRPDLRIVHFTHTPFCGPDAVPGAAHRRTQSSSATRWRPTRRASTPSDGRVRTGSRPATMLGAGAAIAPTFAASLGPDVDALVAVADERRDARGGSCARRRRRRSARDRAQRSNRAVEEHRARLPRLRPAARSPTRSARPRRVRGDALPVARVAPGVSRVRQRGRAGRRARQRSLADARLVADRARRARRLPAVDRRDAALRRARGEPDQGRPQPGGQGRSGGQSARRPAVPVTRGGRVGGAARSRARHAPLRHRGRGGRARHRARDAARRTSEDREAAAVTRDGAHAVELGRRPGRARAPG